MKKKYLPLEAVIKNVICSNFLDLLMNNLIIEREKEREKEEKNFPILNFWKKKFIFSMNLRIILQNLLWMERFNLIQDQTKTFEKFSDTKNRPFFFLEKHSWGYSFRLTHSHTNQSANAKSNKRFHLNISNLIMMKLLIFSIFTLPL